MVQIYLTIIPWLKIKKHDTSQNNWIEHFSYFFLLQSLVTNSKYLLIETIAKFKFL